MAEDAITDEVCDLNPFKGIRIRANDPRAKKKRRPIRVFSFDEMHRFAKAAGRYEALVRTFTDTGMRLGEVLPLRPEDFDGETLQIGRTAHEGTILEGTKTDHGEEDAGRIAPVPATLAWMLQAQINLNGRDCELIFTTPRGRMWRERTWLKFRAIESRPCWRGTRIHSGIALVQSRRPLADTPSGAGSVIGESSRGRRRRGDPEPRKAGRTGYVRCDQFSFKILRHLVRWLRRSRTDACLR